MIEILNPSKIVDYVIEQFRFAVHDQEFEQAIYDLLLSYFPLGEGNHWAVYSPEQNTFTICANFENESDAAIFTLKYA